MGILSKIIKHKFILGICVLFISVVTLTVVLATNTAEFEINNNYHMNTSSGDTEDKTIEEVIIQPRHDYISLSADIHANAKIFVNITTAKDIKNNLVVKGTFLSGGNTLSVDLSASEYSLQISSGSYSHDLKEQDIVLMDMPEDSQKINLIVKVQTANGTISASIPLQNIVEEEAYDDYQAVQEITIDPIASLTNDYDIESLKRLIVVKDQLGNIIYNKELYQITELGALTLGSTVTFKVVYQCKDVVCVGTGVINNITQAEILAAEFSVNSEYRLEGSYYKKRSTEEGEEDKWFSAFVVGSSGIQGSTLDDIYNDGLKIDVYYPNSSRTLEFPSIEENSATATTNEFVVFNNTSFVENTNNITAQVYNSLGGKSVSIAISINFEAAKFIEIEARGYNENLNIVSSGIARPEFFIKEGTQETYIYTRANTGRWSVTPLSSNEFSVSGTLTPTADIIKEYQQLTEAEQNNFMYQKEVTISYGADITGKYSVTVKYESPTAWSTVSVTGNAFPEQTMRMPLNYGNIYVRLQYGPDDYVDVNLTEFLDDEGNSEHIKITLYKDTTATQMIDQPYIGQTPIITGEVQRIEVRFRYNTTDEEWSTYALGRVGNNLTIKKYVVSLPTFDTRAISFSSDTYKLLTFDSSIEQDILNNITLNVYDDNKYSILSSDAYWNTDLISTTEKIEFLVGGKIYYIKLEIDEALADEVEWASGEGVSGTIISYEVTINRGPISPVIVSYENGTWVYGQTPEVPQITGTRMDGTLLNIVYSDVERSDISSNELAVKYIINYYRKTTTGWEETPAEILVVGEYYVQVEIPETENYLGATSTPGPGYGCPTIEITKAPLSPEDFLSNITFDGISRDANDFVSGINGIMYEDKDVVIASNLVSKSLGIPLTSDGKALHAGIYSLELSIAKEYEANYMWSSDVLLNTNNNVTMEIEIQQRNLGYAILNETALDFVYDTEILPTPVFGYNDNFDSASPTYSLSKPNMFLAVEETIRYFNSENIEVFVSDFKKWSVGTYTIQRELTPAEGHLESDYTLPTATATFEITPKEIERILDTNVTGTYTGSVWEYNIINWHSGVDNDGNPILTGVLKGTPFDSDGNLDTTSLIDLALYSASASEGKISIVHAGQYTYTISLNPNYKWKEIDGDVELSNQPIITLTLNQKELLGHLEDNSSALDDYTWDHETFEYNPTATTGQEVPTITIVGQGAIDISSLSWTLHYSFDDSEIIDVSTMVAAEYYYLLTGWTGNISNDGYDLANNYKFPTDKKIVHFTVQSAALNNLIFAENLSGEYKGNAYDFTTYITNLSDFLYGTNNNSKILYYVQSNTSNNENAEKIDGVVSPFLTDTGSYTIYIYPNTNFAWENEQAAFGSMAPVSIQNQTGYMVTFTITPKELTESDVNWGTTSFVYNGNAQAPSPAIYLESLLNDQDKADIKLNPIFVGIGTSNGTTAGEYIAKLNGFAESSTRAFNYTIANLEAPITIDPYQIEDPTMSIKTGAFTGVSQSLLVTLPEANGVTGFDASTLIQGFVFGGWEEVGLTNHEASYADGIFTFLNAGVYEIQFKLTDTQNYQWKNGLDPVISNIEVSRMIITAPALGDYRAMEYNREVKTPLFDSNSYVLVNKTRYYLNTDGLSVTIAGHTIAWEIVYAEYIDEFKYVTSSISPIDYGTYYVQFTILDSEKQNHLNYEWIRNTEDTEKLGVLPESVGYGKTEIAETGTTLFLAYMITRKVFEPELAAKNNGTYIFGDNGVDQKFIQQDLTNNSFIYFIDSYEASIVLSANPTINYSFYALDELNHNFTTSNLTPLDDSELVNGLPWNKGIYGILVSIEFDHDTYQYENISLKYAFEVKARDIIITWSKANGSAVEQNEDGTTSWKMVYDSIVYQPNELLTATIANLAKKNDGDTPLSPKLTITATPGTVRNVGTYTFSVAIDGTDIIDQNYNVLVSEDSIYSTVKITPVMLEVEGVIDYKQFEYGSAPTLSGTDWWKYQANATTQIYDIDNPETIVTYSIINPNGDKFTIGSYEVVIRLADGVNNYVLSASIPNGSIEVIAREITLVLDDSDKKTTSVYQQAAITLGTPYTVTYKEDTDSQNWLVEGDSLSSVFTLKLLNNQENDVTLTEYNPVGNYTIQVVKGNNANYIIHVASSRLINEMDSEKLGEYKITEATLAIEAILGNVDRSVLITYDAYPYDWIKSIENQDRPSLITYQGLTGINLENNNVSWTITKKDNFESVSGTTTNAFEETIYLISVFADNHISLEDFEVCVAIEKAELTLSVDFKEDNALFFGEVLPTVDYDDYSDLTKDIYNIRGFKGQDDRSVITGVFSFNSSDYTAWNAIGTYTTTIDVTGLSADNYKFVSTEGIIVVKELPITIEIPNLSNVYIENVFSMEDTDDLIVNTFNELYEKLIVTIDDVVQGRVENYLQFGKAISDIVTLLTDALLQDTNGTITATNDVAFYPLYLVESTEGLFENYSITISISENSLIAPSDAVNGKTAVFEIRSAENKFTSVFGFNGISDLTNTPMDIVTAWVYGVNGNGITDGYDTTTHKIHIPTTKFTGVPNQDSENLDILYSLYYLNDSTWIQIGETTTNIKALFENTLITGQFNATTYKLEYALTGNINYSDATDVRYFEVAPRDLYVWAKDSTTYYGEDFVRDVETIGLVDNGSGVLDGITDVLLVGYINNSYDKNSSNAGTYSYSLELASQAAKYNNYIVHLNTTDSTEKEGVIEVKRRPVLISIDSKTSQYDFNKAYGQTIGKGEELTFIASLGENQLGIVFENTNPFVEVAGTRFNNETQGILKLLTNALLDGVIETQNVGQYAIFAAYMNDSEKNYDITIQSVYERNLELERIVEDYFNEIDSFYTQFVETYYNTLENEYIMISQAKEDTYLAGTYIITSANLRLTLNAPNAEYNGEEKAVEIIGYGQDNPYGQVSYKAQYDFGNGIYLDTAPVNVGDYPVRIVVENPNYSFDAGSLGITVRITQRELDWSVQINGSGGYSKNLVYGDKTIYLGVGNQNELSLYFTNICTNQSADIADARLDFTIDFNGKAIDGVTLPEAYSSAFVSHSYDIDLATYTLIAQHSGVYTITLQLTGAEAKNYKFPNAYLKAGTTDTYEFKFTINRAAKASVRAEDTFVQYGTPITLNGSTTNVAMFGGFHLDAETLALIEAENNQLVGTTDTSKVNYITDYDSTSSPVNGQHYIVPEGLFFYNYDITYSTIGRMKVIPREIVVIVQGSESKNPFASVVYTGEYQGPNYSDISASHSFFVPQNLEDGTAWYGDAQKDKDVNYATLFNYYLDLFGDGSFGVNGGKGINARTYYMNLNEGSGISNYDVTFKNCNGKILTTFTDIEIAPQFEIVKKEIQVQVGSIGLNNDEAFTTSFTIPYGNLLEKTESTYYYLTAQFEGLVDRDNTYEFIKNLNAGLTYTTKKSSGTGTETYMAWESHSGAIYTILPVERDFENYIGVYWGTAQMQVIPRLVTASTENRIYTEQINDGKVQYNNGVQGSYHAAQIIFEDFDSSLYNTVGFEKYYMGPIVKDEYGVILSGIITEYAPKYSLSYINVDDLSEEIYAFGPRKAGSYETTVSMETSDFLFVTKGSTSKTTSLNYTVEKKKISIRWNDVSSDYLNYNEEDNKQREIEGFINDIMSVTLVNRQYTDSNAQQIIDRIIEAPSQILLNGTYLINQADDKLIVKIYGIGLYTATVHITADASRNYEWKDEGGTSALEYTIAFRVAADSIIISKLEFINGGVWSYGELSPEIEYSTNVSGIGLLYKYASITSIPTEFGTPTYGKMITNADLAKYLDQYNNGYSLTMPTNAGLYVMCAWYPGSDQYQMSEAFLIFEIEKAIIETPKLLDTTLEFKEEDGKHIVEMVYTGEVLRLELDYDTKLLNLNYAGNVSVPASGNGMILQATDVVTNGYSVSFVLSDSLNYTWSEDAFGEFIWKIIPASDNVIEEFNCEELITGLVYGQNYANPVASAKYGNTILIEYLVEDQWVTTQPTQAGEYKVRAVSLATNNYYAETLNAPAISEEISFTIAKKELIVTASGYITYGEEFNNYGGTTYSYQFTGFINGDTAECISVGQIAYKLVDAPQRLEVGNYSIILEESAGAIIGMSADNYTLIPEAGEFIVQKKDITIVLGDASSVYGEKIDLSKVSMMVVFGELVAGDDFTDLNIQLTINSAVDLDSRYNPVASYKVDTEGQTTSKNYNVTVFGSGVYTITPLSIYITVEAGGGTYQGVINPVQLTGVYTVDGNRDVLEEFESRYQPIIRFNYWGSSNDGNWSYSNEDMWSTVPTLAGNYYATAVATQTTNYTLVTNMGTPSVAFVVEKKVLDDTDRDILFAETQEYTGNPIQPVVTDYGYMGLYNIVQTTFELVGNYSVSLTLKDYSNYKWASVDGPTCEIPFEITRGYNEFESDITIVGWEYGNYDISKNLPNANIKFGTAADFTFSYSDKEDGVYTANIPTNAGTYWVKITVPQTDNYYAVTSTPKEFSITKASINAPTLIEITEGENQNTTYTGSRLQITINGYNPLTMRMIYEGDSSVGNTVSVYGLNAGTYTILFALNDSANYDWSEDTVVVNDNAVLTWTIARKQIEKPTMNTNIFMVNGSTLTFIPIGFDEETMIITGNTTSYGGSFEVVVSIKDTTNYEWSDATIDDIVFDWFVIGWDTVFIIVVSVIGIIAAIAGIAVVIQYVLHKRKKKKELEDELAAQGLFEDDIAPIGESNILTEDSKQIEDGGNSNE